MSNLAPKGTVATARPEFAEFYRRDLLENVLPFWFPRCVDTEHGGYFTALDRDGTLLDSDKSVWFQGRMAWMLCKMYSTMERRPEWLEWAGQGIRFLDAHCFDPGGRMYFTVTRDGLPLRQRRYAYSESFAAIAYAAWARATGDDRSSSRAKELFELFTRWNFTPGLMSPKTTGVRPMIGLGPRMITIATAQEIRENTGDTSVNAWIDRCVEEIERLFFKPEQGVLMEAVGPKGEIEDHFDGRMLNPGHAIECAWFLMHEGSFRGDSRLVKLGCGILDCMWERGWDGEFGGIFYFRDSRGLPVQEYWHDMKFWWPHNEAIIATLLAWRLTGESKYAEWHRRVHDWSYAHFPDSQCGEWYGYLHRDGRVSVPLKGNMWKGFFHLPRMQWYAWRLLGG